MSKYNHHHTSGLPELYLSLSHCASDLVPYNRTPTNITFKLFFNNTYYTDRWTENINTYQSAATTTMADTITLPDTATLHTTMPATVLSILPMLFTM